MNNAPAMELAERLEETPHDSGHLFECKRIVRFHEVLKTEFAVLDENMQAIEVQRVGGEQHLHQASEARLIDAGQDDELSQHFLAVDHAREDVFELLNKHRVLR